MDQGTAYSGIYSSVMYFSFDMYSLVAATNLEQDQLQSKPMTLEWNTVEMDNKAQTKVEYKENKGKQSCEYQVSK